MRVLLVHNYYQQPGGEDQVFAAEADLLKAHGHRMLRYTSHNEQVRGMGRFALARATVWNQATYRDLRDLFRREGPAVAHFHNTLPLISPAAYYAARAEGVPVVQTLHNYRFLCPNALFFRDGRVCEECLGKFGPWPGMIHACYRESRAASGVVAAMLTIHRMLRTWTRTVDVYIALSDFARSKFLRGGLPPEKVVTKPNFVHPDPGVGERRGDYFLFVGRLSVEKGVDVLLAAWESVGGHVPLRIVGDGPLAGKVAKTAQRLDEIEWLGRQSRDRVLALMKGARALLLPSVCYENFPMVVAEASAVGLPVIASDLGSMSSLIEHGRTGLKCLPGNADDLAAQVEWALAHPKELSRMRQEARGEFEARYTAEANYQMLMDAYEKALESSGGRVS